MLRGHPIEGDENVWIANSQFGGDMVKPGLAGMLLQKVATRDLRNRHDLLASLGGEHFRKDGEDFPVLPAKHAGKMGFEADDERNETDRYAIEGTYEIEFPKRERIEYRYPFDRRVNVVQRHEISDGNVMRGALGRDQALGRSRGGLSTKIHIAVRGLGCPVRFTLTAGQKGDAPQATALIEGLPAEVVIADTAYDANHLRIAAKKAPLP